MAIFLGRRWELRHPYLYSYGALIALPSEVPAVFRAPCPVPAALIEVCLVTMMLYACIFTCVCRV